MYIGYYFTVAIFLVWYPYLFCRFLMFIKPYVKGIYKFTQMYLHANAHELIYSRFGNHIFSRLYQQHNTYHAVL